MKFFMECEIPDGRHDDYEEDAQRIGHILYRVQRRIEYDYDTDGVIKDRTGAVIGRWSMDVPTFEPIKVQPPEDPQEEAMKETIARVWKVAKDEGIELLDAMRRVAAEPEPEQEEESPWVPTRDTDNILFRWDRKTSTGYRLKVACMQGSGDHVWYWSIHNPWGVYISSKGCDDAEQGIEEAEKAYRDVITSRASRG